MGGRGQRVKSGVSGCALGMHVTADWYCGETAKHTIRRAQASALMWVGTLALQRLLAVLGGFLRDPQMCPGHVGHPRS